ncbi:MULTISPECIES: HNH/ENDO VII family nuclease [Proteus]|uniref:HNH/ENDO VII family nuclease n=1 Tax=Proteus TaxID=583 RepID=UPI0023623122|nr:MULTISPECIES: HNH/ENDO VII family nuclease [Proteus]
MGTDGKSINLHHMTQKQDGAIAETTQSFHQGNSSVIHINTNTISLGIDRAAFEQWKNEYWKQRAETYGK